LLALVFCVLALAGCLAQVAMTPPPAQSVRFGHVFIVVEENTNYSDIVANPAMPYLNGLANQYGLAANYFANAHPSSPNYFALTTGQTLAPLSLTDAAQLSRRREQRCPRTPRGRQNLEVLRRGSSIRWLHRR
jgi:hypothetical protein